MKNSDMLIYLLLIIMFCTGGIVPYFRVETQWEKNECHVMVFDRFSLRWDMYFDEEPRIFCNGNFATVSWSTKWDRYTYEIGYFEE